MVPVVVNVRVSTRGSYSYFSTIVKLAFQSVKIFALQISINVSILQFSLIGSGLKVGSETSFLLVTSLVFSSSGSLSEHQPVQRHQNLQFHSFQDCGREYSRISTSSACYNSELFRRGFLLIAYLIVSSKHNPTLITDAFE